MGAKEEERNFESETVKSSEGWKRWKGTENPRLAFGTFTAAQAGMICFSVDRRRFLPEIQATTAAEVLFFPKPCHHVGKIGFG